MDIKSCRIKNVKAIGPRGVTLNLAENIVTAIGPNGVGKSSLLSALSLFFTPYRTPDTAMFHQYNTDEKNAAEITVTFHKLTEEDKAYAPLADYIYTDPDAEHVWTITKRFYIPSDAETNAVVADYLLHEGSSDSAHILASDDALRIDRLFEPSHMQWIHVPAQEAVCEGKESPFSQLFDMVRVWDAEQAITSIVQTLNETLYQTMNVTDVVSSTPFQTMHSTADFTLLPTQKENLFLNPKYQSHGVQRAVFFALLELYIHLVPPSHPEVGVQNMFLIEDPEMYMDPQMEAHISDLLFSLAYEANVQVVSTTHSAVFVRALENPRSLVRLFRTADGDLTAHQTARSVFGDASDSEQKEYRLRAVREFGTDVSALFFARRVVLVEGATEIVVLQHAAQLLGAFDHGVSLINCHGRGNIPLFQEVLNHFEITYYVVHDLEHEQAHEGTNQHILNLLNNEEDRRFYHTPHIDDMLGVQDSPKWLDAYNIVEDLHTNNTLQETLGDLVSFVYPRYKSVAGS